MPRSNRLYKKKKPFGIHAKSSSNLNDRPSTSTQTPSPNESRPKPKDVSASKVKLSKHIGEYKQFENSSFEYNIVDISAFQELIQQAAVCKYCHGCLSLSTSKKVGLAFTLSLECLQCNIKASKPSSPVTNVRLEDKAINRSIFDINVRFVYALRSIGLGQETGEMLAGLMNLPKPSKLAFYNTVLLGATKRVCVESMKNSVEAAVRENSGDRDLAVAFDGSWQRRGYSSLNGVVTATSVTTGEILDVEVFSKFCVCKDRLINNHSESCIANYSGTSGGMEVAGVRNIFFRSEQNYGVRYKYYLGDGDCKGFETICTEQPYGPDFQVEKMECVGHVQKRMGTRLRKYKQKNAKNILVDNKTIGGRGRLTEAAINTVQLYYGLAIRRHAHEGVSAMKNAIWAEFFHLGSTDETPCHILCPSEPDSWCKYQVAKLNKIPYKHEEHTHLPTTIMEEIRPIFVDLSNDFLLSKCVHGGTQNVSESLNSVIWSRFQKNVFVRVNTLKLGVFDAIAGYNKGNVSKCMVFKLLNLQPGSNFVCAMKSLDNRRIARAEKSIQEIQKKCRQANLLKRKFLEDEFEADEDPDNPSYATGHY